MPEPNMTPLEAVSSVIVIVMLLVEFGLLRAFEVGEQRNLYAIQSFFVALFAATAGWFTGAVDLYVLAGITFALKVIVIPSVFTRLLRRLEVKMEIPMTVNVALSVLIGIALTAFCFLSISRLRLQGIFLPRTALSIAVAIIMIGFLVMITRLNVISQVIGFLTLENGAFVASIAVAPGLPVILEVLVIFDVLAAVLVFRLLTRLLGAHLGTATTASLDQLRG